MSLSQHHAPEIYKNQGITYTFNGLQRANCLPGEHNDNVQLTPWTLMVPKKQSYEFGFPAMTQYSSSPDAWRQGFMSILAVEEIQLTVP
jgi:hypothetical protein